MDFGWSEEQQRAVENLRARTASWREARVAGVRPTEHGDGSRGLWADLGLLGVLGLSVPKRYGGGGFGALDSALRVHAFGEACEDMGVVFGAMAHLFACAVPIAQFGTEAARQRFLPGMCRGNIVAGNAITEPDAGSDLSHLSMRATAVEGGFVLNGVKSFVTNGPVADALVAYAQSDPAAGHLGVTSFVVGTESRGVHCGPSFEKMGLNNALAGAVEFVDCFVPDAHVLGQVGQGGAVFKYSMMWERSCLFASYLGAMDRLLARTVNHAQERRQFGRPIGGFQAVSHRIAEMKLRLESARLLLYRACWEIDTGEPTNLAVALAKLGVSEAAVANALDAVSVFGAMGYQSEHGVEAALRDAVPSRIFSGTSDIQRMIIAEELGL